MTALIISKDIARSIVLNAQLLSDSPHTVHPVRSAQSVIEHLGYVQLDTISVIERAHHHVIWTRSPDYRSEHLEDLHQRRRIVFEYWTHAAALIPMTDFRFYIPRMKAYAKRSDFKSWLTDNKDLCRHVLARIEAEGALGISDFPDPGGRRGPWWDWTPAKRTLETLFWTGKLMIAGRRKFQRLYDLTERVIPSTVARTMPGADDVAQFVVLRTLASQGIVTAKEASWWSRDTVRAEKVLKRLVREGRVTPVRIEGDVTDANRFALTERVEANARDGSSGRVYLLSPFDNAIIDRKRTLMLFDFDYRIECYTPAAKRRYGYFTLPILWEGKLVGRLDSKAERQSQTLRVHRIVYEEGFEPTMEFRRGLDEALDRFAVFNGCSEVTGSITVPETCIRQG